MSDIYYTFNLLRTHNGKYRIPSFFLFFSF